MEGEELVECGEIGSGSGERERIGLVGWLKWEERW